MVLVLGSIIVAIAVMLHVIHCAAIAFLEAVPEFATVALVDGWVLVHLVVVGVGVTAIHVIAAGGFHTFTEALALRVAIPIGSAIPVTATILILILWGAVLRRARWWRRFLGGGLDRCRRGHAEGKSWN